MELYYFFKVKSNSVLKKIDFQSQAEIDRILVRNYILLIKLFQY